MSSFPSNFLPAISSLSVLHDASTDMRGFANQRFATGNDSRQVLGYTFYRRRGRSRAEHRGFVTQAWRYHKLNCGHTAGSMVVSPLYTTTFVYLAIGAPTGAISRNSSTTVKSRASDLHGTAKRRGHVNPRSFSSLQEHRVSIALVIHDGKVHMWRSSDIERNG